MRERKLGTQRHGAAVVDLLHHLLHRGDLGNNGSNGAYRLQDALDEGGICPGERGQSTESLSKAAELANRLPALCTVRSVLCKGLDGEGRSGVEVQVLRRCSKEGVKGDATVLNAYVLGSGGVDVAHDVILALRELLQCKASDVGLDHVGIACSSAPADPLVARVHGVGRGARKALQDPAVKGHLVGAREHEVSAVLVAVVAPHNVAVSLKCRNKRRVALGVLSSQLGVLVAAVKEVLAHSGCIEELLKQGRLSNSQLGGPKGAHKTRPDVSLGACKVEVPEVGVHLLLRAVDVNDDLLNQLSVVLLVGVLALLALLGGVLALAVGVADDAQGLPDVALVGNVLAEGIPGELGSAGAEVVPDLARGGLDVGPEGQLLGGARCSEGGVGLCSHCVNGLLDWRQDDRAVCLDQREAARCRHKPLLALGLGIDDALAGDGEDRELDAIYRRGLLEVIEQVKELAPCCSQGVCIRRGAKGVDGGSGCCHLGEVVLLLLDDALLLLCLGLLLLQLGLKARAVRQLQLLVVGALLLSHGTRGDNRRKVSAKVSRSDDHVNDRLRSHRSLEHNVVSALEHRCLGKGLEVAVTDGGKLQLELLVVCHCLYLAVGGNALLIQKLLHLLHACQLGCVLLDDRGRVLYLLGRGGDAIKVVLIQLHVGNTSRG